MEETNIELGHVVPSNSLALITKFIQEQEPPKPILSNKRRKTQKRQRSNRAQRQLNDGVVRPGVSRIAIRTGDKEVRSRGNGQCEDEEDEPGESGGEGVGLIDAHPAEVASETVELVVYVGEAATVFAFVFDDVGGL